MAGDGLTAAIFNGWLDTLSATAYTAVKAGFAQLHTGDPGAAGTSNVSVGSTTRPAVTLAAASGGSKAITTTLPVWTNGGTSETITNVSFWTAASGGTFVGSVTLTVAKAWASGDTLTLNTFTVSLTPVAS